MHDVARLTLRSSIGSFQTVRSLRGGNGVRVRVRVGDAVRHGGDSCAMRQSQIGMQLGTEEIHVQYVGHRLLFTGHSGCLIPLVCIGFSTDIYTNANGLSRLYAGASATLQ